MTIEIEHKECNGWVIVTKDYIACENAANYHIVEATIQKGSDGRNKVFFNHEHITCCGLPLVKNAKYLSNYIYLNSEVNTLRYSLAEGQNGNWEICGNCVGHFYKDCK